MPIDLKALWTAIVCWSTLVPNGVRAEGIDTEHIFGFMIGSDVGNPGEQEFQSQTTGSFSKSGGRYRAIGQEFELEFVPVRNFRIEMGTTFAAHDINGVPDFSDRRQLAWQGVSVDFRYQFLDRETAPLGLTLALETHADRVDETTAAIVRSYGTGLTLAIDKELIPNFVVAALNLTYQPEWIRSVVTGSAEQIHHRRGLRGDGANAARFPLRRGGALSAEI